MELHIELVNDLTFLSGYELVFIIEILLVIIYKVSEQNFNSIV